jgi:hypothetical protein
VDKKIDLTWERSSQVEKIMRGNKPVRVSEKPKQSYWEDCVKEHFAKQKRDWEKRNNHDD